MAQVMIVDDERALLPLLERYLRKQGFDPVCFSDPLAALDAFRTSETRFRLLMTDLTLEGLSGEELAVRVMELDQEIRVVVMSGYPYSTENFPAKDQGRVTFLQKPFLPNQIREVVERLTSSSETPAIHEQTVAVPPDEGADQPCPS
jgi:DNA-binding NtrC family response regulator